MPISFPTSPTNNYIYTEGSVSWKYNSSLNSWTVQTTSLTGLDNATNHDLELVYLDNDGVQNNQTPAGVGLLWNPAARTLTVKPTAAANPLIVFKDKDGNTTNQFNVRGVLEKAGRILYDTVVTPPNAADIGILWFETVGGTLNVWNGSTWETAAGNVATGNAQTFTAAQTFDQDVLIQTADIASVGASSTLTLKARDVSNVKTNGITIGSTSVVVHQPLEFTAVTATSKGVVATLADNQTIAGEKTFTGGIVAEDIHGSSNDVVLASDGTVNGRSITLKANATTTAGINLRATNASNQGTFSVIGKTVLNDDAELVSGKTLYSHSFVGNTVSMGQFSSTGTPTQVSPQSLGPLSVSAFSGSGASQTFTITNTGSKTVGFYFTRSQMLNSGAYTLGTNYVKLAPSAVATLAVQGTAVTISSGSGTTTPIHSFGAGTSATDTGSGICIKLEMAGAVTL